MGGLRLFPVPSNKLLSSIVDRFLTLQCVEEPFPLTPADRRTTGSVRHSEEGDKDVRRTAISYCHRNYYRGDDQRDVHRGSKEKQRLKRLSVVDRPSGA